MQKLPPPRKARQTHLRTHHPRARRAHAALGLGSPAITRWLEGSTTHA